MKKAIWKTWSYLQGLKNKEEGQGLVEYGLIIALIAVVAIAALVLLGKNIGGIFNSVSANL